MKSIYTCTCNTNFERENDLKGLLSTSIASATTAAEQLLEKMGAIQSQSIIPSTNDGSIPEGNG